MATTTAFERAYIWERPVRLYHWVTVASLLVLAATGLVIGRPPAFLTAGDASASQWFGTVRFLHFAAGYVFLFAFVIRVYWMFAGNEYARWHNFYPLTPTRFRRWLGGVLQVIKVDVLQIQKKPVQVRGHNAMASAIYGMVFLVTVFQIVMGFALYAPMSDAWFPRLFAWVVPMMGGDANVRIWHHLATWFFIVFAAIHVYLSVFHDVVEAEGEISSMVSGSKYFHQDAGGRRGVK
ncbi:MAG: Ni/Fe-hydrogenase, b-type cytochrome subunit [Acidobacteria bacterium]|nr:Ni/Fe-hydrogenase, b-type cytochrome subunit [Acidobacteriota bacterium]